MGLQEVFSPKDDEVTIIKLIFVVIVVAEVKVVSMPVVKVIDWVAKYLVTLDAIELLIAYRCLNLLSDQLLVPNYLLLNSIELKAETKYLLDWLDFPYSKQLVEVVYFN